tara:strand:+ start:147 stop:542 length:396 start_codon:yes stop_codon:yes gene_type:complete
MNVNDLELKISGLEKVIKEQQESADQYKVQLADAKQQLQDINKPEITPKDADNIWEAVNKAIADFDFDDSENYDFEYQLDYDGRVSCSNIDFQSTDELIDKIVANVCNLFKEVDCPEELDTTELDNHKPVE